MLSPVRVLDQRARHRHDPKELHVPRTLATHSRSKAAVIDVKHRVLVLGLGLAFALAGLLLAPGLSRGEEDGAAVNVEELMKPGPLPEIALGPADAKVTIVEYFSMSCPHCAAFATKVFPEIKKKYVDTGKVRFVFREFPHNARAHAAAMLARCVGEDKTVAMIETLMERQEQWAFQKDNPAFLAALLEIAKQTGFTEESFNACMKDDKLVENIAAVHKRAGQAFGISRIPTVFINGKKLAGEATFANVEKMIEELLAKG
jgi:protein-disulfide isomerase